MTSQRDIINHDWIRDRLMEIKMNLSADPDLTPDDLVSVTSLDFNDIEEMLGAYYPDPVRQHRALDIFEYIKHLIGRVAPRILRTSTLKMLLDMEWLAHMRLKISVNGHLPKLYRDHVLHPAYVCSIGWWIMSDTGPAPLRCSKIADLLEKQYGESQKGLDWEDMAKRAWVLAALNHDLLYPLEFIKILSEEESIKKHGFQNQQLCRKKVREIYDDASIGIFKGQIALKALEKMIRESSRSHTPLSALYLIGPESGYKDSSDRRKIIHELAASAVLYHHSKRPGDIDYQDRSLGYLLALADECHEFGREMAVWSGNSSGFKVEFIPPVLSSEIIRNDDDFIIKFIMNSPNEINKLENAKFDKIKYSKGKAEVFERLNPGDTNGNKLNAFSFLPKIV